MAAFTADFILFAINSAIRLNRNAQRAYADSIESRDILLPLPQFEQRVELSTVEAFFRDTDTQRGGHQFLAELPELAELHRRHTEGLGHEVLRPEEEETYRQYYKRLFPTLHPLRDTGSNDRLLTKEELLNLYRIRHLDEARKQFRPLAFVAGNLVKVGIDYFSTVPGSLNRHSTHGKILHHFLRAIDEIPFDDPQESPIGNRDKLPQLSRQIVPQLFAAATESLGELSTSIVGDPKVQRFIQATSQEITRDIYRRLDALQADSQSPEFQQTINWGRLVLHSTLKNAGQYVVDAPAELLDTNAGVSRLIQSTGATLLEAIAQDEFAVDLSRAFRPATLDSTLRAAFVAINEHPEFITGSRNGFKEILTGVSAAMADTAFAEPGYLPELVRLLLQHTSLNLHLFQAESPTGPKNILVTALTELLRELSWQPSDDTGWRLQLGRTQLYRTTEATLDAVVRNPAWIEDRIDDKPLLSVIVGTTLRSLATIPRATRLQPDTFQWLLRQNLRAVAAHPAILKRIKWGPDQQEAVMLQHALTLIFDYVYVSERIPAAERNGLLVELVDYSLEVIIARQPQDRALLLIDLILFESGIDYRGGFDRDLVDDLVEAGVQVLTAHPDLVTRGAALQSVISGIAAGLTDRRWQQADLLPELVRLALEHTAFNANHIVGADTDAPDYLLAVFIRELLLALSGKDTPDTGWQPDLTADETIYLVQVLLDTVVAHPQWLIEGPDGQLIFRDVMSSVLRVLRERVPDQRQPTSLWLEEVLQVALRAVALSPPVLNQLKWGSGDTERSLLEHTLDVVFAYVFARDELSSVDRFTLMTDLLEYITAVILTQHPNKRGLQLVQLILFDGAHVDYQQGLNVNLTTAIVESALRVFQEYPELVDDDTALAGVVAHLAQAIDDSRWQQPGLLPELVRLTLEYTATQTHLMFRADDGSARLLPAQMMSTLLEQFTQTDAAGAWSPDLSRDQLLDLAADLLSTTLNNPHWILPDPAKTARLWEDVVKSIFVTLRRLPADQRLRSETLHTLLWSSLRATANSPALLAKVDWQDDDDERALFNLVLDRIVVFVYHDTETASGPVAAELLLDVFDFAVDTLLTHHPGTRGYLLLDLVLTATTTDDVAGLDRLQTDRLIDAGLSVLYAHPELVAKPAVFQKIVSDTAKALRADQLERHHLVPEFFRLILQHAAGNLTRLMRINASSPRMILITAVEQTLRVITRPSTRGTWRPSLTDEQALDITAYVLEQVLLNPRWIRQDRLLQTTLEAIYTAIGETRNGELIPYATLRLLITAVLDAVQLRKQLVVQVIDRQGNNQQVVLTFGLQEFLVELYDEQGNTAAGWTLTQTDYLHTIVVAFLSRLAAGPANKATVDAALQAVREAAITLNNDGAFILEELITAIENA